MGFRNGCRAQHEPQLHGQGSWAHSHTRPTSAAGHLNCPRVSSKLYGRPIDAVMLWGSPQQADTWPCDQTTSVPTLWSNSHQWSVRLVEHRHFSDLGMKPPTVVRPPCIQRPRPENIKTRCRGDPQKHHTPPTEKRSALKLSVGCYHVRQLVV